MTEALRVRLGREDKERLARRAYEEGLSEAELMRRIIREKTGGQR